MERVDIVLISPPSRMINHYRPPLSLMYVANWYRDKGMRVKIIDIPMQRIVRDKQFFQDRDKLIKEVEDVTIDRLCDIDCKSVGITCYSPEIEEVKSLIGRIQNSNRYKIIVGGTHPTLKPEDFKELADEIVIGRRDNGTCAYDLVDMEYYSLPNPYAIRGVFLSCVYVLSSFGCPSNCTFCVAGALRKFYGTTQVKPPEELYKEIVSLKEKYRVDGFYIIDDLFTLHKQQVKEFCGLIKTTGLLWGCNAKVNTLDEETIGIMAKSGCIQMDFGIERGSNEELQRLKKGQTIEQVQEVFRWCKENHIRTFANFLVNLPGETHKDRTDIKRLIQEIRPTVTSINPYTAYYGTKLPERKLTSSYARWIKLLSIRINNINRNIWFYTSLRYWISLSKSRRKMSYVKQLGVLIKEIINQRRKE